MMFGKKKRITTRDMQIKRDLEAKNAKIAELEVENNDLRAENERLALFERQANESSMRHFTDSQEVTSALIGERQKVNKLKKLLSKKIYSISDEEIELLGTGIKFEQEDNKYEISSPSKNSFHFIRSLYVPKTDGFSNEDANRAYRCLENFERQVNLRLLNYGNYGVIQQVIVTPVDGGVQYLFICNSEKLHKEEVKE